jgi:lysophospholipase L1-like esterase
VQNNFLADLDISFAGTTSYRLGSHAALTDSAINERSAYRFSVEITPLPNNTDDFTEGNDVGIMFHHNKSTNSYYRVSMNAKLGFTRFEKVTNGSFQTLEVNSIGYVENETITMMVEVNGNAIVVWIDNEPVFGTIDANMLPAGTVSLYSQDRVRFDNVLVAEPFLQPVIVLSSPLAYSIALTPSDGSTLWTEAVVLNKPDDTEVYFTLDNGSDQSASETTSGYFITQYANVFDGEHEVASFLRDKDGNEISADINTTVGTGGDYFVTVGDSITSGLRDNNIYNNDSADGRIVSRQGFQSELADQQTMSTGLPQIVFNEGIEGETAAHLNSRLQSILERHPKANVILMMIGTNDSRDGNVTANSYYNLVRSITNTIDDVYGKTVWIATPPPTFIKDTWTWDDTRNLLIDEYNQKINQVVNADYNDQTLSGPNFFSELRDQTKFFDYLHPNDTGYQFMATRWNNTLP